MRFDGRVSRVRYRHRQSPAGQTNRASRITWSTSPIRPRSIPLRATRVRPLQSIRDLTSRGRLPILVGGTGLYYRALTRGFFPGPARDSALRDRLEAIAYRKGPERLHRLLGRVDARVGTAHSAARFEACRARAGGLLPDRPSADRAFRRHAVPAARVRRRRLCVADPG